MPSQTKVEEHQKFNCKTALSTSTTELTSDQKSSWWELLLKDFNHKSDGKSRPKDQGQSQLHFFIARVHEENHIKIKRSEKDGKCKYRCFGLDSKTSRYPVDTR
jgi:hypothetical protein